MCVEHLLKRNPEQGIAIEDENVFCVHQFQSLAQRAARAQRFGLNGIDQLHSRKFLAEMFHDHLASITHSQAYPRNSFSSQIAQEMFEKRAATDRRQWLRDFASDLTKPGAKPTCKNDGLLHRRSLSPKIRRSTMAQMT